MTQSRQSSKKTKAQCLSDSQLQSQSKVRTKTQTQINSRYQLQKMVIDDIPEVMVIEKQVQSHPWTKGIFKDCMRVGYLCWVCREDGKSLVGYLIQSIAAEEMHILNVCIHPDKQRMNLGTLLVEQAEAFGKHGLAKTVFLEVRPKNIAAIRLYQKLDYEQVGLRKNYYPTDSGREDAIVMKKCL